MNAEQIIVRNVDRADDLEEWQVLIPKDVIEAAGKDARFLDIVNHRLQLATSAYLRALYTIISFAEFADFVQSAPGREVGR